MPDMHVCIYTALINSKYDIVWMKLQYYHDFIFADYLVLPANKLSKVKHRIEQLLKFQFRKLSTTILI